MKNINDYLAKLRTKCGYSMSEVHKETGITNSRLSRIENSSLSPQFDDVISLLKLYHSDIFEASRAIGLAPPYNGFSNIELLDDEELKHVQNEIDYLIKHKKGIKNGKSI